MSVSAKFKELVNLYTRTEIEFPHLRAVTVAQWMLESNRGNSELFLKYNNASGIKWRDEMAPFASPVSYEAHDGRTNYCHFHGPLAFIRGYWRFIDRNPYAGWRDHVGSPRTYIEWLKKCGYAEDPDYVNKVLGLAQEVNEMIIAAERENGMAWKDEDITWCERNRNDDGHTVIVAYAGGNPKCIFTSDEIREQHAFELRFKNAGTCLTAPAGKPVLPHLPEYGRGEDPVHGEENPNEIPRIDITDRDSPNCSTRGGTITHIVLHNTAGEFKGSVDWLCNPAAKASAHLVISRQGEVACLVPFSKAAWHAGNSRINHCSIGIELEDVSNDQGLPEAQEKVTLRWLRYFMAKYGIPAENIGIHRWYSSTDCPVLIWKTDAAFKEWRLKHFGV